MSNPRQRTGGLWSEEQLAAEQTIKLEWSRLVVTESPTRPGAVGQDVASLAAANGGSPLDFIFDLAIDDHCDTRVTLSYGNDVDSEVAPLLNMDGAVLAASQSSIGST